LEFLDPILREFARLNVFKGHFQSGKFAKDWIKEFQGGYKRYNSLLKDGEKHPIEKTGERLRSLMPWIQKKNLKGAQAAYNS